LQAGMKKNYFSVGVATANFPHGKTLGENDHSIGIKGDGKIYHNSKQLKEIP